MAKQPGEELFNKLSGSAGTQEPKQAQSSGGGYRAGEATFNRLSGKEVNPVLQWATDYSNLLGEYNQAVSDTYSPGRFKGYDDKLSDLISRYDTVKDAVGEEYLDTLKKMQSEIAPELWGDKYQEVINGITKHNERIGSGYTEDYFGGYGKQLDALIDSFDSVKNTYGQEGYDYLVNLRNTLTQMNANMSQFTDEVDYNIRGRGLGLASDAAVDRENVKLRQDTAAAAQERAAQYNAQRDKVQAIQNQITALAESGGYGYIDVLQIADYEEQLKQAQAELRKMEDAGYADAAAYVNRYNRGQGILDSYDEFAGTQANRNVTGRDELGEYLGMSTDRIAAAKEAVYLGVRDRMVNSSDVSLIQKAQAGKWYKLNEDEINIYYNVRNQMGEEAAMEFLEKMKPILGKRATDEVTITKNDLEDSAKIEEGDSMGTILGKMAQKGAAAVALNALSVAWKLIGAVPAFVSDFINTVSGKEINPYDDAHMLQNMASGIRGAYAERINDMTGAGENDFLTWGDVYQSIMSTADSAIGSALGGAGYAGIMGMDAASSKARELYEKGADRGQIVSGALLSGAAEMVFEKISLEHFADKVLKGGAKNGAELVRNILLQGGVEASEEIATEIANTITEAMVQKNNSQWEKDIRDYQRLHPEASRAAATANALANVAIKAGQAGVGGFISGAGMGTFGSKVGFDNNVNAGQQLIDTGSVEEVLNTALEIDPKNSEAKRLMAKLENGTLTNAEKSRVQRIAESIFSVEIRGKENGKPSSRDLAGLGQIYQQNIEGIAKQDKAKVQAAVENRLRQLDESGRAELKEKADIKAVAEAITKQVAGEQLSLKDRMALRASTNAQRVINEMNPENIASGDYNSQWATEIGTDNLNMAAYNFGLDEDGQPLTDRMEPQAQTGMEGLNNGTAERTDNTGTEQPGQRTAEPAAEQKQPGTEPGKLGNEQPGQLPDGSQERNAGERTGEQSGSISGSTAQGQEAAGRNQTFNQRFNITRDLRGKLQKVSPRSLGIENGSENASLYLIDDANMDDGLRSLRERIYQETGSEVTFVAGKIRVQQKNGKVINVRGVKLKDGRIISQVDHSVYTADQICDHEAFHQKVELYGTRLVSEAVDAIKSKLPSPEMLERVLDNYLDGLAGVYDVEGMTDAERDQAIHDIIMEELLADAYSGINSSKWGATKFTDIVNEFMDSNFIGKQTETETQTERGPPAGQRFSIDENSFTNEEEKGKAKSIIQQLNDNLNAIMQMSTVVDIDEKNKVPFQNDRKADGKSGYAVFQEQGGSAYREGLGLVALSHRGARDSVSHGNGEAKQAAFPAVKPVIENGIEIFRDYNHNGENFDTITFAAPVNLYGEKIAVAAVIKQFIDNKGNRTFYIHEVCDSNGNFVTFGKEGTKKDSTSSVGLKPTPDTAKGISSLNDSIDGNTGIVKRDSYSVETGDRYSFGGEHARGADAQAYDRAIDMEYNGASPEEIRRETGWFRGEDDRWRFEIDDSQMQMKGDPKPGSLWWLGDLINHDALFMNYPQLRDVNVLFSAKPEGHMGSAIFGENTIELSNALIGDETELLNTLTHEIQHMIQGTEKFARGANTGFWKQVLDSGEYKGTEYDKNRRREYYDRFLEERQKNPELVKALEDLIEDSPSKKGIKRGAINWDTLEQIEEDPVEWQEFDARRDALEAKYPNDFFRAWDAVQDFIEFAPMPRDAYDLYHYTAGEIEAREAAGRRTMDKDSRRETRPWFGGQDTVFTEDYTGNNIAAGSIENGNRYSVDNQEENIPQSAKEYRDYMNQKQAARDQEQQTKVKPPFANAASMSKAQLRQDGQMIFSIKEGSRGEANKLLDAVADRFIRNGEITEADRENLFDRLVDLGQVTIPAEESYSMGREYIKGGTIYVDPGTVADFGDDWKDIRSRAFAAGLHLTTQRYNSAGNVNAGADMWNSELAAGVPGLFDPEETDSRNIIERIVQVAEEGKDEHVSLAEYTARLANQEHMSEQEFYTNMERQLDTALMSFARSANIELKIKDRTERKLMKDAQDRAEKAQRARERKQLAEMQKKTMKQLQWLKKNQNRATADLRQAYEEVLSDIDLFAINAANEMNRKSPDAPTWRELADMYKEAQESDPNFMPSKELEKIIARLDNRKIGNMDIGALQNLYQAAVGLRTEFYNRNNVIADENHRLFSELSEDTTAEIEDAKGKYTGRWWDNLFNREQLTPMNYLERMVGWNKNAEFMQLAKQLEKGERDRHKFVTGAERMLSDFLKENEEWVAKADGQGKDGEWIKLELPELVALEVGKEPEFGKTVTVYMTPAQKVHLYLESKNVDNLRHMTGGRTFVNKELYSKGNRTEALAQGTTVKLAPETVKAIVSNMTAEEMALANLLEKYYNEYSTQEINRVSNILYGYNKAMGENYAPIYTNQNYTHQEFGVFDVTAEGVGNLKERKVSFTPSYNLSAFDAFEKHMQHASRFVGMAIPTRNWNTYLNWRTETNSTRNTIAQKWGQESVQYIEDLITELQDGGTKDAGTTVNKTVETIMSNYISGVFGMNPSIVLKQMGSIPLAAAYLGMENLPSPQQIANIDRDLIAKYTPELDNRVLGYAIPETKQLKENPGWAQKNKFFSFVAGGGAITAMDGWAASTLWPWAENKVQKTRSDLEVGSDEYYKAVAAEFDDAVARSQSTSDMTHSSLLRKSTNPITRALTLFRSDSAQTYNAIRQKIGEAQYLKEHGGTEEEVAAAKKSAGTAFLMAVAGFTWAEGIEFLMNLWKHKGKRYRDDDDELTAQSITGEMLKSMLGDMEGVVVGGEELAEIIGNVITGEKWYGIDTPGMEQVNDALEAIMDSGKGMISIMKGAADIAKNDGDLGQYFSENSRGIAGNTKSIAETAAMYISGLPAQNMESYLMGLVSWASPEMKAAYDDIWKDQTRGGLKGADPKALPGKVGRVLDANGLTVETDTRNEIARLVGAGLMTAVPMAPPDSVNVEGEKITLGEYDKQKYKNTFAGYIGTSMDEMMQAEDYQAADEETRAKMLKRLYDHAADLTKNELFGLELGATNKKNSELAEAGVPLAAAVAWDAATVDMKQNEKAEKLMQMNFTPEQKESIYRIKISDSKQTEEDIRQAKEAKISFDNFLKMKATLDGSAQTRYMEAVGAGIREESAFEFASDWGNLPKNAKTREKWKACVSFSSDVEDQLTALSLVMSESQMRNMETAVQLGMKPVVYVDFWEHIVPYDSNKNGSYSQAEITAALKTYKATDDEKAIIWQLATGSKKPYSNPFGKQKGKEAYNIKSQLETAAKEKQTQEDAAKNMYGQDNEFAAEIMRQLLGG